jgi:signal transduction histidine kinase
MLNDARKVIEAFSNTCSDEFFTAITLALHKAINADCTFIAVTTDDKSNSKTIALVVNDKITDNLEFSLEHSPFANAADNSVYYHPKNASGIYQKDQLLSEMETQGVLGIPLHDSKQKKIGLLVAFYKSPLKDNSKALTLFQLFSGRITAELANSDYEKAIEENLLSNYLSLATTTEQLKLVQQQLVESEKMASLGGLIAGITHEVNTPLGIAITTNSIITDEHRLLNSKIASEHLSMKDMQHYCHTVDDALTMQSENLIRAKKLIENFKKTAVDQHHLEIETININNYYTKVVSTLTSILKTKKASIVVTGCEHVNVATYPGIHAQILTNLITNSVRHGFNSNENNNITINIAQQEGVIEVHYEDNGIGLSNKVQKHIFEPFFTTARQSGGIGLGMSIVYNLLTEQLKGSIHLGEKSKGACFVYQFKASNP